MSDQKQVHERPSIGPSGLLDHVTPTDILQTVLQTMRALHKLAEDALVGSFVRVTSDHNGQPYGRSRKSWKGDVCRIKMVHVDARHGTIQLVLERHEYGECFIPGDEVEFV